MLTTKESISTYVAGAAYGIAALLFVFPLLDAIVATVPMQPAEVSWRYAAFVRISRALLPSLLGGLLALSFALFLEQQRVVRGIAIASAAWAAVLVALVLLFLASARDVRAGTLASDTISFDVLTSVAVAKYIATALISLSLAAPAWMAARRIRHEAHLLKPDVVEPPQVVVRPHAREAASV